jgi:transcriptional regulator with XRE-family HTH domain
MISEVLRQARKNAGLTQEELAKSSGLNRSTISKYESGVITPPVETLQLISAALNVSVAYLLGEKYTPQELSSVKEKLDSGTATYEEWQRYWEQTGKTPQRKAQLSAVFELLNEEGQLVAIERLEELAEIPKYQRKNSCLLPPNESEV